MGCAGTEAAKSSTDRHVHSADCNSLLGRVCGYSRLCGIERGAQRKAGCSEQRIHGKLLYPQLCACMRLLCPGS